MKINLSQTTQVVVSTYNPEVELLQKNLLALVNQFCHILIVDDGSKNTNEIEKLVNGLNKNIEITKLPQNHGIAATQNIGLSVANAKKMKWLLTMDQDSIIPDNLSAEYQKVIDQYEHIGLIGWDQQPQAGRAEINEDWWILSSGCLLNVNVLNQCQGFDEDLFIDHVDTDVCVKIRNLGYHTLVTSKVKLSHQLGIKTSKKTIRGANYHEHPPIRVYYIVRNGLVLFRRYFFKQPQWMMNAFKVCLRESLYLIYFQRDKLKNAKILFRAWRDGIFNKLGRYEY